MHSLYSNLMFEQKWSMRDIDNMDILYFFELIAFKNQNPNNESNEYIDNIL